MTRVAEVAGATLSQGENFAKKQWRSEGNYCKFSPSLLHHWKLFPAGFKLLQPEKLSWNLIIILLDALGYPKPSNNGPCADHH